MHRNWRYYVLLAAVLTVTGVCVYWFEQIYVVALPLALVLRRFFTRHARNKIFWFLIRPLTPIAWRGWIRRLMQWRMQSIRRWQRLPLWVRITSALPVLLLSCYVLLTANELRDYIAIIPAHFSADLLFGEWVRTIVVPYFVRWLAARGLDHIAISFIGIVPESVRKKIAGHANLAAWHATRRLVRIRHRMSERRALAAIENESSTLPEK